MTDDTPNESPWKWRHDRLQERIRVLENRIGFAGLEIGSCLYCNVGNKPGKHHDMRCPLHDVALEQALKERVDGESLIEFMDREQALKEPGAEEGGEDIFEMPKGCTKWSCANALLVNFDGFRVCSNCGASYGKAS